MYWRSRSRGAVRASTLTCKLLIAVLLVVFGGAFAGPSADAWGEGISDFGDVAASPLFAESLADTTARLESNGTDDSHTRSVKDTVSEDASEAEPQGGVPAVVTMDYTCLATCGTTCVTTCNTTCLSTCYATCSATCNTTCIYTCDFTCDDYTCGATCQTTCDYTCLYTCDDYTCGTTCGTTCDYTCIGTCGTTCGTTCDTTCGTTCGTTCDTTCGTTCDTTCFTTCDVGCGSDQDDNVPGVPLPSSPVAGTFGDEDLDDVYRVTLQEGQTLDLSLVGAEGTDFDLYLYDWTTNDVTSDPWVIGATEQTYPEVLTYTVPAGQSGIYFVDVYKYSGTGAYTLTYTITGGEVEYVPISGDSRYETACLISQQAFPSGAPCVVITTGMNWPDALGGASLAAAMGGPILLTVPTELPDGVLDEIDRLGATEALILGGYNAVSEDVEDVLNGVLGAGNVDRIGGESRYETADMIAQATVELLNSGGGYDGVCFVATGSNFPDAVAASPLAAAEGWPVFLAASAGLTAASESAMAGCGVSEVLIVGGTAVVSDAIESHLVDVYGDAGVTRLAGPNRYATAAAIACYGCDHANLSWNGVAIATGENFPDALAGGVLQGLDGSVVLLTPQAYLHPDTETQLLSCCDEIFCVKYLGGTNAVSDAVRAEVTAILE